MKFAVENRKRSPRYKYILLEKISQRSDLVTLLRPKNRGIVSRVKLLYIIGSEHSFYKLNRSTPTVLKHSLLLHKIHNCMNRECHSLSLMRPLLLDFDSHVNGPHRNIKGDPRAPCHLYNALGFCPFQSGPLKISCVPESRVPSPRGANKISSLHLHLFRSYRGDVWCWRCGIFRSSCVFFVTFFN